MRASSFMSARIFSFFTLYVVEPTYPVFVFHNFAHSEIPQAVHIIFPKDIQK